MNSLVLQTQEIKRLNVIGETQEEQMKELKEKCAECENKISLSKFLEHYWKG